MSTEGKLVLAAEKALKIDDDVALLKALAKIVENWRDLASKVGGLSSAETLVDRVIADIDSDDVKQALTQLGLDDERATLSRLIGKVRAVTGKIPDKYRPLLEPLSKFGEAAPDSAIVGWSLAGSTELHPIDQRVSLKLDGEIGAQFEAGDTWPFDGDAMPARLLRIGAKGTAGAAASLTLPYQFGTVTGSAGGGVALGLDYYFNPASSGQLYALAVAERLIALPDPFDYQVIRRGFAGTDLAGLIYRFEGSANVGTKITFGESFELLQDLTAVAGLEIDASLNVTRTYTLSVRAETPGVLLVTMSRSLVDESNVKGSLGITLDLSRIGARIHRLLSKALERWDKLLKEVKPFLTPGTWLQEHAGPLLAEQVKDLLGDKAFAEAVTRDLRGAIGIDPTDRSAVADWVSRAVKGAIDRAPGALVKEKGGDAVKEVATALAAYLPTFAQVDLQDQINGALDKLLAELRDKLKAEVDKIAQKPAKEIGEAIKRSGGTIDSAVGQLDSAVAGVRSVVECYDTLFRKIVTTSEEAAKARLTARFLFEEKVDSSSTYQFAGRFTDDAGSTADIFDAVLRGNLQRLATLLENPGSVPGVAPIPEKCSIRKYSARTSKTGFEIALLSLGIDASTLLSTSADVLLDGNGTVHVDTKANLTDRFRAINDEVRELTFVDAVKLNLAGRVAAAAPRASGSIDLGFNILNRDPSMSRKELTVFLESLEKARLLSAGTTDKAGRIFDRWSDSGMAAKLEADVAVKVWLSGDAISGMLQLASRTNRKLKADAAKKVIGTALAALEQSGGARRARLLKAAELGASVYLSTGDTYSLESAVRDFRGGLTPVFMSSGAADEPNALWKEFTDEQDRLLKLVELIEELGTIYEATPDPTGKNGWDARDYRDAQDAIGACIVPWFKIKRKLVLWARSAVHPRTVALLRTISDLAGYADNPPVSVVMTNRSGKGGAETIVLT